MLARGVEKTVMEEGEGDWRFPVVHIIKDLKEADLLFGNLESVISDKGYDMGGLYSFRASPEATRLLTEANFSVLSVANNHSFDYTVNALVDCMNRLKNSGINYIGGGETREEAHSPTVITLPSKTTVGILGYTAVGSSGWQAQPYTPGIAWMDTNSLDVMKKDIEKVDADITVVSMHFGEEYEESPNKEQRIIGESAIEFGADLVVGHHPHVLQPLEEYKDGWIAWSLGNFIFDQDFSEETMTGGVLDVRVKGEEITSVELKKTRQNSLCQVEWK